MFFVYFVQAMLWGRDHEDQAVEQYEERTGVITPVAWLSTIGAVGLGPAQIALWEKMNCHK